jgi:2,3-bisphosphoglycerate-dependent phosphoglycerate mutase
MLMPKRFSAIPGALPVGEPSGSYQLVLVRHGESEWNRDGRFAGWTDIDLIPSGEEQARRAGRLLAKEGHRFDFAITSLLKRSIRSQWIMLELAKAQLDA